MHKICPDLDLKMYDGLCPQNWSHWVDMVEVILDVIKAVMILAEEIRENYLESFEEDDSD